MKYTVEDINKFRKSIADAISYAEDAGDQECANECDNALDFLVHILNTMEGVN